MESVKASVSLDVSLVLIAATMEEGNQLMLGGLWECGELLCGKMLPLELKGVVSATTM